MLDSATGIGDDSDHAPDATPHARELSEQRVALARRDLRVELLRRAEQLRLRQPVPRLLLQQPDRLEQVTLKLVGRGGTGGDRNRLVDDRPQDEAQHLLLGVKPEEMDAQPATPVWTRVLPGPEQPHADGLPELAP